MKHRFLILSLGFLVLFTAFMVASVLNTATVDAAKEDRSLDDPLCSWKNEEGKVINLYNDPDLSTGAIMDLYHKRTNDEFNRYIRLMITAQEATAGDFSVDLNSQPPEPADPQDPLGVYKLEEFCEKNRDNYSTFCVAKNLLTDGEQGDGYVQYVKALECRRGDIAEDIENASPGVEYVSGVVQEAAYAIRSWRIDAIDREVTTAKRALDQTLSAYDELKTAWPMHQRYIKIYESLVKFRDKMVEIRHQIEEYPSKFIDATTTMCT